MKIGYNYKSLKKNPFGMELLIWCCTDTDAIWLRSKFFSFIHSYQNVNSRELKGEHQQSIISRASFNYNIHWISMVETEFLQIWLFNFDEK